MLTDEQIEHIIDLCQVYDTSEEGLAQTKESIKEYLQLIEPKPTYPKGYRFTNNIKTGAILIPDGKGGYKSI